ncbi:hypothetical protein [Roseateles koreensis]|uniref:Uncharacterized protein n=1 Tax=Roseateles koreensis TaxID=2987526 RepID=A0ABT5KND6_9BURK|nr:hypothetical protein [Roseateles koreensis]MDC8784362.1 hypothetical protein [Roseateles koreensis]
MTLLQLTHVKRWMDLHQGRHPVELCAWDLVLTAWVLSWMALPVSTLLGNWWMLPLCLAGFLLPTAYANWRRSLHRRGRLRCDWLTAL